LSVYSSLNSPLYTTFPLFTPLSAIIFPISPHLSPPVFGRKKAPTEGQGLWVLVYLLLKVTSIPTLF